MKKIILAAFLVGTLGIFSAVKLAGPVLAENNTDKADVYEQLDLFGDIFDRIRSEYVEEVDSKELIEAAINGMLTSLDPHSGYLPPVDAEKMREQTRGEFGGLGIEVTQEEGFVKVVSPIDGTPADEAGMEAGDFITHVDGESVLGLTLNEAVERMRGPVGSEIIITVVREGEDEPFDVTIIRDFIKLTAARVRTEGKSVVIRVTTFNDNTFDNIKDGLDKELEKAGGLENINGVVIDLRNNPGGLLNQAIRISDFFLENGEIVSTKSRKKSDNRKWFAKKGDITDGKTLLVLINYGSASASEIVAGALKDHKRAIVIGENSYGKGSVQSIIPLKNRGAIRLTVAKYYLPSGKSISEVGVRPDIEVNEEGDNFKIRTETDNQLNYAIKLLNG